MLSINSDRLKKYWTILWFILFSGSLYFQILRIRLTMVIVGVTILGLIFSGWTIRKTNLNLIMIYLIFIILNIIFTFDNGVDVNDFILLMLRFVFLIIIQSNMTELEYKKIYVDIMVFEAILSIICFLYADVLSLGTLPLYRVEYGSVNGYMYAPYYTVGWTNVGVFGRNAGWFLEPGAHQIFLNFAVLFLLSDGDSFGYNRKKYWFNFVALAIAVLTTQSTTGYMCFLVIMCATMFMKKRNGFSYYSRVVEDVESESRDSDNGFSGKLRVVALIALIVLLVVENTTGVIENKFEGMYTGQSSAATRYNDTIVSYGLAFSKPLTGYGIFNTTVSDIMSSYGVVNNSNGLAGFLTGTGIVLGVSFLICIFCGMRRSMPYGQIFNMLAFIFVLLCMNSEGGVLAILMYLTFLFEWNTDEQEYLEE